MAEREITEHLVDFARSVRQHGVPVSPDQTLSFLDAAGRLGPMHYYWAGRTTLTTVEEHVARYDAAFSAFWTPGKVAQRRVPTVPRELVAVAEPADGTGGSGSSSAASTRASDVELLRGKDFAELTDAERVTVERAIRRLRIAPPSRPSRRSVRGGRDDLDLRRMARCAVQTGGIPIRRAWRQGAKRVRRGVLLLDVSASMSQYSRAILLFAHSAVRSIPDWEAFCFSTRLTSVSKELRAAAPDMALSKVARRVAAWDDGTRLGDSLQGYLSSARNRGRVRGAVCVICSDGLDVGDPQLLASQMRRLSLLANCIVWVNPLYDEPGYEPIAGGMKAALPYADHFVGAHSLARLEELAELLSKL